MEFDSLADFLASDARNGFVHHGRLKAYVRKSARIVDDKWVYPLDIASVSVDRGHQGQGYLRSFLDEAESLNLPLYVESILADWLVPVLERRGYTILSDGLTFNAYRNGENTAWKWSLTLG